MKLGIILGTRPEIIKMAPVIQEAVERNMNFFVLHTGQHYSWNMDKQFFDELSLPQPTYNLGLHLSSYPEQLGKMVQRIIPILKKEKPDVVLVQGDTVSVLAGALAAKKCGIGLAHHEAGLRSNDLGMLEEINRIVTDSITDIFFCPTEDAVRNLREEGHTKHIFLTGNTIVDAVLQYRSIAEKKSQILAQYQWKPKQYILVTLHRAENVDAQERLATLLQSLHGVYKEFRMPLVYPIHPRTRKRLKEFNLTVPPGMVLIDPIGFLDFLQLESHAKLIFTDSGGVQEEACTLGVPCVTLRDSTERPETVTVHANIIAGIQPSAVLQAAREMMQRNADWRNPFGDGTAGKKIVSVLLKEKKKRKSI